MVIKFYVRYRQAESSRAFAFCPHLHGLRAQFDFRNVVVDANAAIHRGMQLLVIRPLHTRGWCCWLDGACRCFAAYTNP